MKHVCPWWVGYFLLNPLRRFVQDPHTILRAFVADGMTVVEPGPGMGYFTLDLARLVGPSGRVVAVDLQPRMLQGLRRRAEKAGLIDRIEIRRAAIDRLGLDDLDDKVDFVLAFAMVHELPKPDCFLEEVRQVLKPGARILLAEPKGHVTERRFAGILHAARGTGLLIEDGPDIWRSRTAVLVKRHRENRVLQETTMR